MSFDLGTLGWRFVEYCFHNYEGTCKFMWFFGLAVIYLLFRRKESKARVFFIPYLFVLLLTVFNPFLMKPLVGRLGLTNEYYRFFWLVPVVLVIPYVMTRLVMERKKKWVQALILVLCVFLLYATGTTLKSKNYPVAENIYKIPQELIEINQIIEDDFKEKDLWEEKRVIYDLDLNIVARQYDPSINITVPYETMMTVRSTGQGPQEGEPAWTQARKVLAEALILERSFEEQEENWAFLMEEMGVKNPVEIFMWALNVTKTQYIVYPIHGALDGNQADNYITAGGCYEVGRTENYVIWCYSYAKPDDYIDENL